MAKGREAKLIARLIALIVLSVPVAQMSAAQALEPSPEFKQCRREAAQRMIADFVLVEPPHERVAGSQIIVTTFRNKNPYRIEDYAADCMRRTGTK